MAVTQGKIDNFVMRNWEEYDKEQLIGFAMTMFCLFYNEAKQMVKTAFKNLHIT